MTPYIMDDILKPSVF